jgi:hypothetical protein
MGTIHEHYRHTMKIGKRRKGWWNDWNKAEVGRRVGLSRTAIWKYMKKWDIPLKRPT